MTDISAGLLVAKAKEQLPYTHKVYETVSYTHLTLPTNREV